MGRLDLDNALRIALLEDDDDFREELVMGLGGFGFSVRFACARAADLYRKFESDPVDVLILDANVPGDEDGFSVMMRLRESRNPVGIVMLTGRNALADRVRGLQGGADAYLTKPVDLLELSSIIRSLARRMRFGAAGGAAGSPLESAPNKGWMLRDGGWILVSPDGATLALSDQERVFLGMLMEAGGEVVNRRSLAERFAPEVPDEFELRRIDVLVSRLRAKALAGGIKLPVLSVRGQGYVFAV